MKDTDIQEAVFEALEAARQEQLQKLREAANQDSK